MTFGQLNVYHVVCPAVDRALLFNRFQRASAPVIHARYTERINRKRNYLIPAFVIRSWSDQEHRLCALQYLHFCLGIIKRCESLVIRFSTTHPILLRMLASYYRIIGNVCQLSALSRKLDQYHSYKCHRCERHTEAVQKHDRDHKQSADCSFFLGMNGSDCSWKQRIGDMNATIDIRRLPTTAVDGKQRPAYSTPDARECGQGSSREGCI